MQHKYSSNFILVRPACSLDRHGGLRALAKPIAKVAFRSWMQGKVRVYLASARRHAKVNPNGLVG